MEIRRLVARRSDLSTFLVHLTRDLPGQLAPEGLASILRSGVIRAESMFGAAKDDLENRGLNLASQKCVCFTETPLEYTSLLLEEIVGRAVEFRPYGIAIPKKMGRLRGVNPVWYVDISPGHDWLMGPIDSMVEAALTNDFDQSHVSKIAPFVEQMGTARHEDGTLKYRKEFWWEREWRHVGLFILPQRVIVLAPESEHMRFLGEPGQEGIGSDRVMLDPDWGLEQIISRLAGYQESESDIL